MPDVRFDNPFHDLWMTEATDASDYVKRFSPTLVKDAEALFSAGNIVLKGRQGSGKSMLLALFDTSVRLAYEAVGSETYPLPKSGRCFISAGINLVRDNASQVANRALDFPTDRRQQLVAAIFADYVNTLLCIDLIKNVLKIAEAQQIDPIVLSEVPINLSEEAQARALFALRACDARVYFSVISSSLKDLYESLRDRSLELRKYFNLATDQLPSEISGSRLDIGFPVLELVQALKDAGVIPKNAIVYLRVDQHEEIFELERKSGLGPVFRQVINSALARRDSRVAYRVGTRHYAWDFDLTVWGSGAPIEEARDYNIVDLDGLLRRGENSKGWRFPIFAEDVIRKRLEASGFRSPPRRSVIDHMFGTSLLPANRAVLYAGKSEYPFRDDSSVPTDLRAAIKVLWDEGQPLEAWFAAAWLRQRAQSRGGAFRITTARLQERPWGRQWWRKERNEVALMQLAGQRQQALIISGSRQVLDLAGHNILAFMTICRAVWMTWLRRRSANQEVTFALPRFEVTDQAIGINEASQTWFRKVSVGLDGDNRVRFVSALGRWFRSRLLADKSLSNPGHNGFSLAQTEIFQPGAIQDLIKTCRDHGDIMESPHTTKNKDQAPRLKWYLHPLLCPVFRLPHIRTKEPIYTTALELEKLFERQAGRGPGDLSVNVDEHPDLFDLNR